MLIFEKRNIALILQHATYDPPEGNHIVIGARVKEIIQGFGVYNNHHNESRQINYCVPK